VFTDPGRSLSGGAGLSLARTYLGEASLVPSDSPRSLVLKEKSAHRGIPQVALFLLVGYSAFWMRMVGSWALSAAMVVLGSLVSTGLGYCLVSIFRSAESGTVAIQIINFPIMMLSGSPVSAETLPVFLRPLVAVMPLTYLSDGLRQIMVGASPLYPLWGDFAVLGRVPLHTHYVGLANELDLRESGTLSLAVYNGVGEQTCSIFCWTEWLNTARWSSAWRCCPEPWACLWVRFSSRPVLWCGRGSWTGAWLSCPLGSARCWAMRSATRWAADQRDGRELV
jgi:hypothetical protein